MPGFGSGPFGNKAFGEWKWSRRVLFEHIPEIYRQQDEDEGGLLESFMESLRPSFDDLRRHIRDLENIREPFAVRTQYNNLIPLKLGSLVKVTGELEQRGSTARVDALNHLIAPQGRFNNESIGKELRVFGSAFPENNITTLITGVVNSTTVITADILVTDVGPLFWEVRPAIEKDTTKVTVQIRSGDVSEIKPGWLLSDGYSEYTVTARRQFPALDTNPLSLTVRDGVDGLIVGGNFVSPTVNFGQKDVGRLIAVSTSVVPENNVRWEIKEVLSATEAVVTDQAGNPPDNTMDSFFWAILPFAELDLAGQTEPKGVVQLEGLTGSITAANTFVISSGEFTSGDVGKLLTLRGSANAANNITTTIVAVSGSEATVSDTLIFPDNGIFTPPSIGWEMRSRTTLGDFFTSVTARPTSMITTLAPDFGIEIDTQESEVRQRNWVANVHKWIKQKGHPKAYEILGAISGFEVDVSQLYRLDVDLANGLPGVLEIGESASYRSGEDGSLAVVGSFVQFYSPYALFSVGDEGTHIRIRDASVVGNNKLYTIETVIDSHTVKMRFQDSVTLPEANNGALSWAIVRLYSTHAPSIPNFDEIDADFMEAIVDGLEGFQTTNLFSVDKYCWEEGHFADVEIEIDSVSQIAPGVFEVVTSDGPPQGPSSQVGNASVVTDVRNWSVIDDDGDGEEFFLETVPVPVGPNYVFQVKAALPPITGSAILRYNCPVALTCAYCGSSRVLATITAGTILNETGVPIERALDRVILRLEDVVPAHVILVPRFAQTIDASLNLSMNVSTQGIDNVIYMAQNAYFDDVQADILSSDPQGEASDIHISGPGQPDYPYTDLVLRCTVEPVE